MKRYITSLLDKYIFADDLTLDARRHNTMLAFGFLVAVGCTVMRIIEGATPSSYVVQTVFILAVVVAAIFVNRYKLYTFSIYATIILLDFILFPLAFFVNGGLITAMPAFFAMGIALIALLVGGRRCILLVILNIIWVFGCYLLAYHFPWLVQMPASPMLANIDHIGSFLMVSLFIGAVIKVQDHLYARERAKVIEAHESLLRSDKLRSAVNDLAMTLLNTDPERFDTVFEQHIVALAKIANVDRVNIWRNVEKDGALYYTNSYCWSAKGEYLLRGQVISYENAPGWYERLSSGNILTGALSKLSPSDRKVLEPFGVVSLLVIPAFYQNQFEGFTSFDDMHGEREFTRDEIDILRSASLIIINAVVRNEINRSLVQAREEALAGNRAKSEFLSNMSHEIRTPMNAILGMISIAKNSDDPARKEECLNKMGEASTHLLGVISDVLDMSKIEANKLELSTTDFSFKKLIDRVTTVLTFQVNQKRLNFKLDLDARIPDALHGDEQRISQAITNLLSNAMKFTPEEGTVSLIARLSRVDESGINEIDITISDTGIGIAEKQLARLFEPFQQAESSTSRRFGGTGLGLAISKSIVDLMGGSIEVQSQVGAGTTFCIHLPLESAHGDLKTLETETATVAVDLHGLFKGHKILMAEDVEVNREIVLAFLETTGIEIDNAGNGNEAVALFKRNPEAYDLILMDVQMPELDGCDATRIIRGLDCAKAREIPIVALTANVFKDDIAHCLAAGMNDHIGKPLDQTKVIDVLRKYL